VSEAAQALMASYDGEVEIVAGPHKETQVPASVKHLRADVLTLDGRVVG